MLPTVNIETRDARKAWSEKMSAWAEAAVGKSPRQEFCFHSCQIEVEYHPQGDQPYGIALELGDDDDEFDDQHHLHRPR